MIRLLLTVAVFVLALATGLAEEEKGKAPEVKLTKDEQALVDLVNKERGKRKLSRLVVNPLLCKVARQHTENMAKQEKMAHVLDGKKPGERVLAAGYDYLKVGENLAKASGKEGDEPAPPPADVHEGWMKSKGHRGHIIEPKYTEVGVSMVLSKKGTYYYTMIFAVPDK
jgi:uncharacterized protein YkwD